VASAVVDTDPARSLRGTLDPYARPRLERSLVDLATSVVPYFGLVVAMYFALRVSVLITLALSIPAAGFLIRAFIVFHDCTHGSFMRSRRANNLLGAAIGLLVWMPFRSWQHEHAVHHATSGDLDRRGIGDITTLTVAEYRALGPLRRLGYRLFRSPLVMFGLGWLVVIVVKPRLVLPGMKPRIRNSVLGTDLTLAAIVAVFCLTIGWRDYLLVQAPIFFVAGAVGTFLFYVQHQFEDTYWESHEEWRYEYAALEGSSYLQLPRVLQFFTGNIGFHHVHHLSVGIPNYNLQEAHEKSDRLREVPVLTLREALRATRLKLWDEQGSRLVGFRDARA
jgi:omega-6 fatty acid desaturase (delta-12 desaturase)